MTYVMICHCHEVKLKMFIFNSKCLFLTSAIDPPPIEEASVSMAGMAFIA